MPQTTNRSYALANWPELQPVIDKAASKISDTHARLITRAIDQMDGSTISGLLQVSTNDTRRMYTVQDLIDSAFNETSQQRIIPDAVDGILFGQDGLIHRSGGGRAPHLMEDIEVAYIVKPSQNLEIGPIITSGRNRLMALQVLLEAASPGASIGHIQIRCSTATYSSREDVERRIVSANMGSRTMARAEIRERHAGGKGLNCSSRDALIESLSNSSSNKVYPTAFGALLRQCAEDNGMEELTKDQFAASGVTTYNALLKSNKDLNKRIDSNTDLLVKLADCACEHLQVAIPEALASKSRGPKSGKLAKILTRKVAERYQLSVIA